MKYRNLILITFFILLFPQTSIGRTSSHDYLIKDPDLNTGNKIDQFEHFDYSVLFSGKHSIFNIGCIGQNYRRIRVKLISVLKNPLNQRIYYAYGKSNVLSNICEFQGNIEISEVRQYNPMHYGVDHEYKEKGIQFQGLLIADYVFYEHQRQKHSGYFSGKVYVGWYLNKDNKIIYDDIESFGDRWCNSQFVGTWKSYSTNQKKVCNWGRGRVPQSGDLDVGAGEFYPNKKYWNEGWKILYTAWWLYPETKKSKESKKLERLEWWK